MATPQPKLVDGTAREEAKAAPAAVQAVTNWVSLLGRAIKTSRLYDGANPIVVRFREELSSSLRALHDAYGSIPLKVRSDALVYFGEEVHASQSRDDQLAAVFHRDGIRQVMLEPGMASSELERFLDQILWVTGPLAGEDDLVTLLWDANLPHVILETVPLEGEADGVGDSDAASRPPLVFPRQERVAPVDKTPQDAQVSDISRSEDWSTGETSGPLEQAFEELLATGLAERLRFQQESQAFSEAAPVNLALRLLEDCFANDLRREDLGEFQEFIPRVLREALATGDWQGSAACLRQLRRCDPEWSVQFFCEGLCGPFAITTRRVVDSLDHQDSNEIRAFLDLVVEFGSPLGNWLMHVLAESRQMNVRRPLARTIADLLEERLEVLAPWASDERWYVVRNVVHILGWIRGDRIVGQLAGLAQHPEPRVRSEVVAALAEVSTHRARPILMKMVVAAEKKLFSAILQQLENDFDPSVAEVMLGLLREQGFAARPEEERRALFLSLSARGDVVVSALDAALNEGGLFSRGPEPDRTLIALCLARISTPAACAVLERGLKSKRAPIRKACIIAGAAGGGKYE